MSDSNRISLRYVAETVWGTTPANPAFTELAFSSESLAPTKETIESATLRSDRNKAGIIQAGQGAAGDVNAEVTEALVDLIEAALQTSWSVVSKSGGGSGAAALAGIVTLTASTQAVTFASATDYDFYKNAKLIRISSAATGGNNGVKTVVSRDDVNRKLTLAAGSIVSDGSSATTAAMVLAIKTAKNATTAKSFTVEKYLSDVNTYQRYVGTRVNSFSIDLASKAIITAAVGLMSKSGAVDTATIAGATVTSSASLVPASASVDVGAVLDGSTSIATGLTKLSVAINNNLRDRPVVGSAYTNDFGAGECSVEGSLSAYFADNTMLTKFLGHTTVALFTRINLPSGKVLSIFVPSAHITSDKVVAGGKNQEVVEDIEFKAQYDSTYAASVVIDLA